MEEKNMTPKHRVVVTKLRERLEQYRKRHTDCQTKQERSLAVLEDQERQEAMKLHQRVLEGRNTKVLNPKMKQQEAIPKMEHPSNGLELKSTNAILQQQIILKRKHDQGMNNIHMSCDSENGQIGGETLTKYPRADEIHNSSLVSHEHQISMPSSQADQQGNSALQGDPLSSENLPSGSLVGSNGHYVGDTSRSSPLLSSTGAHTSENYQNANRVASPNSLPPTEFKQESHSVAVSCDGGRSVRSSGARDSLPNGIGLANSSHGNTDGKSTGPGVGQELQEQLNDFERVLMSYTNNDIFKNPGIPQMNSEISPQHHQITRPTQSSIDARDTRNVQQQQNPSIPNQPPKNPYPTPPSQGPPGPIGLHLQHLARQAQNQRAQAVSGYMDGQEQDASQQFRSQQMQFMDSIRFAVSGSQPQMQNQNSSQPQFSAAGRFRGPMATGADQFGNMYSSKDQNHNVIMSTGFASNTTQSLQYQRMMQSQAQQQALYSRLQQQNMSQRLSHPTIPEHQQTSYQQYPTQPSMSQTVPQVNNMPLQNLPPYQTLRSSQTPFQRQLSMPLPAQGYPEQYAQQMNQYQVGDQQVPTQPPQPQQTDMSSTAYHYNHRRNSFPLYHRSMSQPVAAYGPPGSHPGYQGQVNQMRNNIPGQNASNAMIDGRANAPSGYSYNRTSSGYPPQSGLQGLVQMPQRGGSSMSHAGAIPPSRADQQNLGYVANMRDSNAQNMSQDMKYSTRSEIPKVTRGESFNDPIALSDPTSSTANSEPHYNPFSPLSPLEKAPSFASLLEQSSGSLNNLETTYTGSIPNLDLLGEIIG